MICSVYLGCLGGNSKPCACRGMQKIADFLILGILTTVTKTHILGRREKEMGVRGGAKYRASPNPQKSFKIAGNLHTC